MVDLQLQPDERILLSNDYVYMKDLGSGDLVLTNYNIIFYTMKTFGRGVKSFNKFPLSSISMLNGDPRVTAVYDGEGEYVLTIYTTDRTLEFSFYDDFLKGEAIKWVNTIFNILVGHDSNEKSVVSSIFGKAKSMLNSGGGVLGETAASLIGGFKTKLDKSVNGQKIVTVKCPGCGAPITGYKGDNKRCEYCETQLTL